MRNIIKNFLLEKKYEPGTFVEKVDGTFLKTLIIIFLLIGTIANADSILLIPVGKTEALPFKPYSYIHVSNGKILKLREQGGRILATGISAGELTLTNQSQKYKTYVLDQKDIDSYNAISKLTENMRGLKIEIMDDRVYVTGELLRLSDWEKISNLSQEKNLRWILKAKITKEFETEIMSRSNEEIQDASLPIPTLSASPELQAVISSQQKNYIERYHELLEPFGYKMIQDKNALQLEPMVDLSVKMVELKKNYFRKLGVDFPQKYTAQVLPQNNFKVAGDPFQLALNALEQDGHAKIIASPHLSCRSGKEAHFLAGGEFPIKIMNFQTNEIQWKKHGILLTFKPIADRSGKMSLSLSAEISMIDQAQAVDGIPGLLINRVESHLDLKQSQTIAISGLIKEHTGKSNQGLAFLKNLPVLGLLFSSEDFREDRTELVVFVTPKVLSEGVAQ